MRWKLVILSSLATAAFFASVWFALAQFVLRVPVFLRDNRFWLQAFALIVIINAVSIFIYRRTSKRRKTQAFLAAMLTLALVFALLFAFSYLATLISSK